MDVVKYAAPEMKKEKILIPTTFGTGAEMTTYCVLKFDGKKKLLREDRFLADMAVVDSYFMDGTPQQVINSSVCDACAQATEGYDSKLGNDLTRTLCKQAFEILYDAIMNDKPEKLSVWFNVIWNGIRKLPLQHLVMHYLMCSQMKEFHMGIHYLLVLPLHTNITNQSFTIASKKQWRNLVLIN